MPFRSIRRRRRGDDTLTITKVMRIAVVKRKLKEFRHDEQCNDELARDVTGEVVYGNVPDEHEDTGK